jgi:hypothetical protein
MELCSSGHKEICYVSGGMFSSSGCPMCEALEKIAELENIMKGLNNGRNDAE